MTRRKKTASKTSKRSKAKSKPAKGGESSDALGDELDSDVFSYIDESVREDIVDELPNSVLANIVRDLDSDDVIDFLEDLDEEALVEILTKPKNALVKQYQRLFEMEDTKLTFSDSALKSISSKAVERKTGARGLRSIMESILLDTMFDLPAMEGVEEVVINGEVVEESAKPLFIYGEKAEEVETSA